MMNDADRVPGGKLTAELAHSGLFELYHLGILNESMEAVICDNPRFHALFTGAEIAQAHRRLEELDYFSASAS
jgi:hypothetical protein